MDILEKIQNLGKKDMHSEKWFADNERLLRAHISLHPIKQRPIWWRRVSVAFASIVILLGGISTAAAYSAPGSVLYGWKLKVNERLESAITFDIQEKAELEVERVKMRLEEKADQTIIIKQQEVAAEAIINLAEEGRIEEAVKLQEQLPLSTPMPLPSLPIPPTIEPIVPLIKPL